MYRGLNVTLKWSNANYYQLGISNFKKDKVVAKQKLEELLNYDILKGAEIQQNWFPQIAADVFISHSHADEDLAITLAGWLKEVFNITAFVDSCIWSHSIDLLKAIDNEYCLMESGYYSYELRNKSTSHVHMMLATALSMMLDKCECLFFLNTPSSISSSAVVNRTESPWIYYEIATSQVIRKRRRDELGAKYFSKAEALRESFSIEYDLDLNHMVDLTVEDLKRWQSHHGQSTSPALALDGLYKQNPLPKSTLP